MQLSKAVRIWPHKLKGEGHFTALIQKSGESGINTSIKSGGASVRLTKELEEFLECLKYPLDKKDIRIREDRVFLVPESVGGTDGLRVMREGLFLGELKKHIFEPSQALAMVLKREQYESSINLTADGDNVIRYLKGETIQVDEDERRESTRDGWQLVCVDGYPLGWGKLSGTTLKNKYLAGWRMM